MNRQPDQEARHQSQSEALYKRQPGMIVIINAEGNGRQHRQAEHHQQEPKYPLYDGPVHLDKRNADLEEALQVFNFSAICHEQDDVVLRLDHRVMMRDDDLVAADDRDDSRALR